MPADPLRALPDAISLTDEDVVARVRAGDRALFEIVMRRYNQRLYRVARAILGDSHEAEDVMQDAYVRAFAHLDQFAGRSSFATWLTRIAVHEALARLRRRRRFVDVEDTMPSLVSPGRDPEQQAADRELGAAVEAAVESLPEAFRVVFILRELEGLDGAETAACLGIPEETVKTRLHRARSRLREALLARAAEVLPRTFAFGDARCDRLVAAVLARIGVA